MRKSGNSEIRRSGIFGRWYPVLARDFSRNRYVYLMLLPVVAYYIIFHYQPMYGAQIAFRDFSPGKGILDSPWIGFSNFADFFGAHYFWRVLRNTLLISGYTILWGFPAPIILALLLNEVRNRVFKRGVQTITYLPHFISIVVVCGIILDFMARDGIVNGMRALSGAEPISFMVKPEYFRTIYVASNVWQTIGWESIVYLAALSSIDTELFEACKIDGGGRFRQLLSITLPGLAPTIVILLILRLGRVMNIGAEKILLLYNPNTYETADVVSTFVYRSGLIDMNFSYSAAVGLFNSLINFTLLVIVNNISKRVSETSLW
jgi:putative aldouronate transport system permease protein